MEIKVKKLSAQAALPTYAHVTDAGADLYCSRREIDPCTNIITYHTDLAFEIPEGYVGLVFPRSSIFKTGQSICNSVGVIDSSYRGEIMVKTYRIDNEVNQSAVYSVGDRIAQLVVMPFPHLSFVEGELSETERGTGGYGSTGS